MLICTDCGLHYDVVWNNDGDSPPNDFCPRCGCESIDEEPQQLCEHGIPDGGYCEECRDAQREAQNDPANQ
jgi:hypothetical protein